ncbi:hypothetical protein [Mesorhizobium tianshanense]|uniref:hypothetical protein n=1 Tax=Mesorhizobium tianshanense TaxID=39844 RepID=UPI001391E001|nr:hypothetical protein [Mesorhizobium tianshanense]
MTITSAAASASGALRARHFSLFRQYTASKTELTNRDRPGLPKQVQTRISNSILSTRIPPNAWRDIARTHHAAFAAFEAAATEQGLHKQKPPSVGLKEFDGVAEDMM